MIGKSYSHTFNGSGTDSWEAPGGGFFIVTSGTNLTVDAYGNDGTQLGNGSSIGQGDRWQPTTPNGEPVSFGRLIVNSTTAQTVTLFIGFGNFTKGALLGTVSLSNEASIILGTSRALAGQCYWAATRATALTAQNLWFQILNPAGSGKTIYIHAIGIRPETANDILNVAYTDGNVVIDGTIVTTPAAVNKKLGGPASIATLTATSKGSNVTGFHAQNTLIAFPNIAEIDLASHMRDPIVMPPGTNIVLTNTMLAATMDIRMAWFEA